MFSECASSQIGSIDSYTERNDDEGEKVEELVADPDDSDISLTGLQQGSKTGSKESILDALDFSSDEEDGTKGKKKDDKADSKSGTIMAAQACISTKRNPLDKEASKKKFHSVALSRFYFASPGPAAYQPTMNFVKSCAPAYLLTFRHATKHETLGPGPAYNVQNLCCTMKYNEMHFAKRFEEVRASGPGPAEYDVLKYCVTGRFKPKARVLSRRPGRAPNICVGPLPNIYGMTRRGKARPPNPILIGKPYDKLKMEPGPGAYDPQKRKDTRVGIRMRRRPPFQYGMDMSIPGPKYLLPSLLSGPSWSLKPRWKSGVINTDSPGPIYKPTYDYRKPVSMTFRPFPLRTSLEDPGPLHYAGVGEQWINTKQRAPHAVISGRDDPYFGLWRTPGPNRYLPKLKLGFTEYNMVSMKGRWKSKTSSEPGPADYDVPHIPPHCKNSPKAVFPHRAKDKKSKDSGPGFKYDPKVGRGSVRNVILAPRWRERKTVTDNVPFYDLSGFTQRGKTKRIPVSFKSRQSPFVYQGLAATTKANFEKDKCHLRSLRYENPSVPV